MRKNDVRGVSVYILENARIGPVLNIKFAVTMIDTVLTFWSNLCF